MDYFLKVNVDTDSITQFMNILRTQMKEFRERSDVYKSKTPGYPFKPFGYIKKNLGNISEVKQNIFIQELCSTKIRHEPDEKIWSQGCELARVHFYIWSERIIRLIEPADYQPVNFREYLENSEGQSRSELLVLCGYMAQSELFVKKLQWETHRYDFELAHLSAKVNNKNGELKKLTVEKATLNSEIANLKESKEKSLHENQEISTYISQKGEILTKIEEYNNSCKEQTSVHAQIKDAINEIEKLSKTKQAIVKELDIINASKQALGKEMAIYTDNLYLIKQSVITNQEKLKRTQFELDETNKLNSYLQNTNRKLNSENDELENTYLANMAKARLFLSLDDDVAGQYRALMSSLQNNFQREYLNQHIMMSLFWKICFHEFFTALVEFQTEQIEKHQNIDLKYNEIVGYSNKIGNIVLANMHQFVSGKNKVHNPDDENDIRKEVRARIKMVLDEIRTHGDAGIESILEAAPARLFRVVPNANNLFSNFVEPVLRKVPDNRNTKLSQAMLVASLEIYLRKYGDKY